MKKLMLSFVVAYVAGGFVHTVSADPVGSLNAEGEGLTFKEQGAFEIYQWNGADSTGTFTVPEGGATVDLLLVGGGGAGGFCRGGGGGGGGVIYKQSYALDAGSYTVTVGAGGVPDAWTKDTRPNKSSENCYQQVKSTAATCGGNSELKLADVAVLTAVGGGGGGSFVNGDTGASEGLSGGSGGGSAGKSSAQPVGTENQGFAGGGGGGVVNNDNVSGGGGGAGAAGVTPNSTNASGNGGDGIECSITGSPVYYGGGGGGGAYEDRTPGQGGQGGGGNGGYKKSANEDMTAGVDGLGGGGGGSSGSGNKWEYCIGAPGGSGVVIVRYQKAGAMALNVQVDAGNARELDVTASVTASDGAETDTFDIYLACSDSDENFDYAKVGEDVALNAEVSKAFVGLDSDSLYYVAAKAYNRTTGKWSDPLVSQWRTSAAESPVQIMGPGITKTETGYEVFVRIDHFQGNVSDCTLTYKGEAKAVTGVGTYVWQVKSAESDFSATVDLAYQAGGVSYGKTITQRTSGGASVHIADFATLDESFFFEGDRILLPEGGYSVLGDAIATVSGNVVYCKKSGFTLLYDGVSDYRVCVVPHPPAGGDVFYYFSNNGNGDPWTSATWTKVTQNTERAYPDDEKDIAIVEGGCNWAKMLVDDDISLHGYVVGVPADSGTVRVQLETSSAKTLTFCGSEADPAFFNLSSMHAGDCGVRLGKENGTGSGVLSVYVSGRLNFDWCGDSLTASPRRNAGQIQWCSAIVTVPEGSTLAFVNDSKAATDSIVKGGTTVGHIAGAGTVIFGQSGGIPLSFLKFAGDEFAGDVAVRAGEWKGMVEFPDSDLTVFDAPNAGRKTIGIGYDLCKSNPGRNQIDAKSVTLDGGCLTIYRNYAENSNLTPWTEGATTDEEKAARLTVTNEIKKLIVKGDSAFYCDCSYGTPRVRQHLILDEIEHDQTGTICLYDFNFRDKSWRTDPLHYDRVRGEGLAAHAVGRDPQPGDSQFVYKIIPWIACTANDNGYQIYNSWGSEMTFPALTNGVHGLALMSKGRTNPDLNTVGEWDNVYFSGKGITSLGGKTIHSLVYNTAEQAQYLNNLVLGAGKTLTIKSGGLIMARTGRWLGCTQTAKFAENGSVAFGGERAYVICDFGKCNGDNGNEYNVIWTSMIAPNGLTKGGCGELVFATDQRGIDGDIAIGGGTLWLGHPANYTKLGWLYQNQSDAIPVRGCATDVEEFTLRPGAVLAIPSKGYDVDGSGTIDDGETAVSKNAVITLIDNAAGSSKVEIAAGADQTCKKLYISGRNKGKALKRGTYGATGSGAANIDDDHFAGSGVLTVRKDDVSGIKIILR